MMVSASDWLLMLMSSMMEQLTLFSVVNIPLTSLYAHRAITRDCWWEEGPVFSYPLKCSNKAFRLQKSEPLTPVLSLHYKSKQAI